MRERLGGQNRRKKNWINKKLIITKNYSNYELTTSDEQQHFILSLQHYFKKSMVNPHDAFLQPITLRIFKYYLHMWLYQPLSWLWRNFWSIYLHSNVSALWCFLALVLAQLFQTNTHFFHFLTDSFKVPLTFNWLILFFNTCLYEKKWKKPLLLGPFFLYDLINFMTCLIKLLGYGQQHLCHLCKPQPYIILIQFIYI